MAQLPKITTSREELKILRLTRKKKSISCREVNFWKLEDLVHKNALDKYLPKHGRNAGWPRYKLSRRAVKLLEYYHDNRHR